MYHGNAWKELLAPFTLIKAEDQVKDEESRTFSVVPQNNKIWVLFI
jgi:hypothetical protein